MNGKQNIVFFLGITLLFMVFWVNGYWGTLSKGINQTNAPAAPQLINPKTGKVNPPTKIEAD